MQTSTNHSPRITTFRLTGLTLLCLLFLIAAFMAPAQAAETAGNTLPYESWLRSLQQSLTGPVAFSVALIGIVSCGATLIFAGGEIGRFMRALIYIIMVMTLLIGANSLMSKFFNGASIGDPALLQAQHSAALKTKPEVRGQAYLSLSAAKVNGSYDPTDELFELAKEGLRTGNAAAQELQRVQSAAQGLHNEVLQGKRAIEDLSSLFRDMRAEQGLPLGAGAALSCKRELSPAAKPAASALHGSGLDLNQLVDHDRAALLELGGLMPSPLTQLQQELLQTPERSLKLTA